MYVHHKSLSYEMLLRQVRNVSSFGCRSVYLRLQFCTYTKRTPGISCSKDSSKEKKLFTPGPLCVSPTVKAALARDMGSRDTEFIEIVRNLRSTLVDIADLPKTKFTAVLMQGSGTFAVESVLQSTSDRQKSVLIVANGAYGKRMKTICDKAGIPNELALFAETQRVVPQEIMNLLDSSPEKYSSVAVVHCETTSGIVNDIEELGMRMKDKYPDMIYIVDAMSSFAGIESDYSQVDFLISSANKCIQGVPGFAFAIARIDALEKCKERSTSLALDLYDQWRGLEDNGQFRFTPPTHAILGLKQACVELLFEGGVPGRAKRYSINSKTIQHGMAQRGFRQLVSEEAGAGHIITSFHYPDHPNFHFEDFYKRLSKMDQLIYPGKVTNADCFRIGHIGHLNQVDMQNLLNCIDKVLQDMNVRLVV